MLSFFENKKMNMNQIFLTVNKKINTMSLQVRCSPLMKMRNRNVFGKRVLPFISLKQVKASMTVEAAIVLPLFVFFAAALLVPMRMLDTQRKLQTTVEMACEDLSFYMYLSENGVESGNLEEKTEIVTDAAAGVWLSGKLADYGKMVDVKRTQVPDENGDIVLEAVYREKIPFFSESIEEMSLEVSAKKRGWIGISGKLTVEQEGADGGESDVEMVYVGKSMGRYHKDRSCHYISNDYQTVSLEEAKSMRDAYGHRFTECASCGMEINADGTVYITAGGRKYHGTMDCGAMVSYVQKVPLSEVLHLGACSYCGGK